MNVPDANTVNGRRVQLELTREEMKLVQAIMARAQLSGDAVSLKQVLALYDAVLLKIETALAADTRPHRAPEEKS